MEFIKAGHDASWVLTVKPVVTVVAEVTVMVVVISCLEALARASMVSLSCCFEARIIMTAEN